MSKGDYFDTASAICFIPPQSAHESINSVRQRYDRAYPKWPPHINWSFPSASLAKFDEVKGKLTTALAEVKPFTIDLTTIDRFSKKGNSTFHLKPADKSGLEEVFDVIHAAVPELTKNHDSFKPHLTLGQCRNKYYDNTISKVEDMLDLSSYTFTVDRVYMVRFEIVGQDDRGRNILKHKVVHEVMLGGGDAEVADE